MRYLDAHLTLLLCTLFHMAVIGSNDWLVGWLVGLYFRDFWGALPWIPYRSSTHKQYLPVAYRHRDIHNSNYGNFFIYSPLYRAPFLQLTAIVQRCPQQNGNILLNFQRRYFQNWCATLQLFCKDLQIAFDNQIYGVRLFVAAFMRPYNSDWDECDWDEFVVFSGTFSCVWNVAWNDWWVFG